MKKVLFTMVMLTSMVAGTMVFSSFTASKTNDETVCSQISMNDGWRNVGEYYGYDRNGHRSTYTFIIWEKEGVCGSFYWTYTGYSGDPDKLKERGHSECTGQLRQNSEKKWYAAYNGTNYFIDF